MNVGVFLPNWIGDVVMATPTLRALRKHFGPRAVLTGVMRPYVADVLAGTRWLDEQLFYAPRSKEKELGSRRLIQRLRRRKLDTLVLLTNSLRSGLLGYFSGAKQRVGYVRYCRGPLLTHKLQPPREGRSLAKTPMVDYYLKLAYALDCEFESPALELATTREDKAAADLIWSQLGLRDPQRVVVFNSSGAFGGSKLWPPEHFAELARRTAMELDHQVLVICGPSEREIASQIVRDARHPGVVSLARHPLSIGVSKECVRRSRLMVTTDSGPRHFAVAFGVPIVSLFGPTPPVWGENATANEVQLQNHQLDCLGCHKRVCPLEHHRCMKDLSVQRVFAAVADRLQPQRKSTAA